MDVKLLLTLSFPLLLACGSVKEVAEDVVQQTHDLVKQGVRSVEETLDDASAYIEAPQREQRQRHCKRAGGTWVEVLEVGPCIDGAAVLRIDGEEQIQRCGSGVGESRSDQCVHRDSAGLAYFNDGPSTPAGLQFISGISDAFDLRRWSEIFWDVGVQHDYCYHHNGITRGQTQQTCDEQMLQDLTTLCAAPQFAKISWFDPETCRRHAALAFLSVRGCGSESYEVQDTEVDYPTYEPMHQRLGIDPPTDDKAIQQEVDSLLETYNPCG
jgi:hypothetical protein